MKRIIVIMVIAVVIMLVAEVAQAGMSYIPVNNTISRQEAIEIRRIAETNNGQPLSFGCSQQGTFLTIKGKDEVIQLFFTLDGRVSVSSSSEWASKIRKEVQEIIK